MFNTNKEDFISTKSSSHSETNISLKNYDKYSLSSADKFKTVSRIDNTLIYVNVDSSYKKEVVEYLKKLGY